LKVLPSGLVKSRGELNGRPAILLWWKEGPHDSSQLWVDATTYLPIRSIAHQEGGMIGGPTFHTTIVTDYDILAPTPDNLARLHPPVPPGFPRVAHAEPTGS